MNTTLIRLFILATVLFTAGTLNAQNTFPASGSAGIGTATPNAASILEIKSTTKGVLMPRMTAAQKTAIASPLAGLVIYQTDGTKGLYHYNGSAWKAVAPAAWNLAGNGGTTASQFLGTTDSTGLKIKTKNIQRAVFDANGNFGIGTANPAATMEAVGSSGAVRQILRTTDATSYTSLRLYNNLNAAGRSLEIDYAGQNYGGALLPGGPAGEAGVICTTGPFPLVLGTNNSAKVNILSNGNVGIGTETPGNKLSVAGNANFSGNVGIGTVSPSYKLEVCGVIRANEVRVEIGWCDYVFADDYILPALSEVEAFIKTNRHLPDVTKGSIIETEGLEVGKTSAQMIKKIEELTLYVIDLQKQVDELKKNNK